jgi:hypothetical protein
MPHSYWAYCGQGYVYIAVHEATYKIGCAMIGGRAEAVYTSWGELAGVRSRMNALRKQTRKPFRLLHLIYTPVCVKGVEAFIHSQLDDSRRGKREHFMLDAYDLDWLFSLDTFDGYPLTHMEADVCPGE